MRAREIKPLTIAWEAAARKMAISAIAGFLASAFALGALVLSEMADSATPSTPDDWLSASVIAGLVSAVWGAGLPVALTVLLCLLIRDTVRLIARQLAARGDAVIGALRRFGRTVRDATITTFAWLRPVLVVVGRIVLWTFVGAMSVMAYLFPVSFGIMAVHESTRIVNAVLEDPPSTATLALGMAPALALMYAGLALLAFCLWFLYALCRDAIRSSWRGTLRRWTSG